MKNKKISALQRFADGEAAASSAEQPGEENSGAAAVHETTDGERELEFEKIIKGEYKDAFRKRTQEIIDKRFAKLKQAEKTAQQLSPVIERLNERFPSSDGDIEKAVKAFLEAENSSDSVHASDSVMASDSENNSESNESEIGEADTSNVEKSNTENEKASDAQLLRNAREQLSRKIAQRQAERVISDWKQQAQQLTAIYPDFELEKQITAGGDFAKLLSSGVPMQTAFEAANLKSIMATAMRYAAAKASLKTAQSMASPQNRIQENPVLDRASSVRRTDVNSLTEKDIRKIIGLVGRGEKISF